MSSTRPSWRTLRDDLLTDLRVGGVPNADADARWIIEAVAGASEAEILAGRVAANERTPIRLAAMRDRRLAGEPVQYIVGEWSFRDLELMVDPRVLIPRPETEWVVEVALEAATTAGMTRGRARRYAEPTTTGVVADLGTGSGAIALALESELPHAEVWATDASSDALAVARANGAGNGATRVRYVVGDWFHALPPDRRGRFDLVVSNPPYIAERERDTLPTEVLDFEPADALFAGPTGLEAVETIVTEAPEWLTSRGVLVIEIAPHQSEAVRGLAEGAGFREVQVRPDLAGRDRVLVAKR